MAKPGVQVVTPDPFPSGSAKWNVLAAYGAQRKAGKSDHKAVQFVKKLFKNVVAQHSSGSNAANTFFSGKGDVLLTYESEAYAAFAAGKQGRSSSRSRRCSIQLPMVAINERPGQGEGVHQVRPRAQAAADLRRQRLSPGREIGPEATGPRELAQEVQHRPDLQHRRPALRRLAQGQQGLVRPEQRADGDDRAGGRRSRPISAVTASAATPSRRIRAGGRGTTALSLGAISTFLAIIVVLPIAALLWEAKRDGAHAFWQALSNPEAVGALKLTFGAAFVVVVINGVLGTVTAWVLVRDDFRGKSFVNSVIDLPFALPTIVAGLTLLTLYGPHSPVGIHIAFTRASIVLALCFVTLPFVVRTVQPVLIELDTEMEEAARSLGAGEFTVFRRIVLPNLFPGILSGVVLAFARALGEIGAVVVFTGTCPTAPRSPRSTSSTWFRTATPQAPRQSRSCFWCCLRAAPRLRGLALLRHEARPCLGGSPCAGWPSSTSCSFCSSRSR